MVVNLCDVKITFDENERLAKARLEKALNVVPDKPSQVTAGENVSPVVVDDKEILCSTVVVEGEEAKGHTINSRSLQSNRDVRAAIREGYKARAARGGEA